MRKKFLSAILLAAMTLAATSTMTSCKDYDGDISSLKGQIASLEDVVNQKEAAIKQQISALETQIAATYATKTELENCKTTCASNLDSYKTTVAQTYATIASLESAKQTLQDAIDANYKSLTQKDAELDAAIQKAQAKADDAYKLATDNADAIAKEIARAKEAEGANADAIAKETARAKEAEQTNANAIAKVAEDLASLTKEVGTLSEGLKTANQKIGELEGALAAQKAELIAIDSAHYADACKQIADAKAELEAVDKQIKQALADEIAGVEKEIEGINATLDELQKAHATVAAEVKTITEVTIPAIEQKIKDLGDKLESEINVIAKCLSTDLRSLVFIPDLYVDGIEAIKYPFLKDTTLVISNVDAWQRQRAVESDKMTITGITDYVYDAKKSVEVVYGPAWPVDYHLNPTSANPIWSDAIGFTCRKAEVVTRALSTELGITSPEKYDDGSALYAVNNGIVTVGIKLANPKALLKDYPEAYEGTTGLTNHTSQTGKLSEGYDHVVALQMPNHNEETNTDTIITSDYALLHPEVVHPEGIVWVKSTNRFTVTTGAAGKAATMGDETVSHSFANHTEWDCTKLDEDGNYYWHVWDKPYEALMHKEGTPKTQAEADKENLARMLDAKETAGSDGDDYGTPALYLSYNSANGITLSDYIGTHVQKYCDIRMHSEKLQTWNFGDEKKWGLHYEFELIDYSIDGNVTHDSRYAHFKDADENGISKTGQIIANDVTADGKSDIKTQGESTVGREPLVRVMLKDESGNVFLDGYILLRISRIEAGKDIAVNEDYPAWEHTFDLCDGVAFEATTWSQFDEYILDNTMGNMDKDDFDRDYKIDMTSDPAIDMVGGGKMYHLNVYADTKGTLATYTDANKHKVEYGSVIYRLNTDETTNHTFILTFTEDELEALTHGKKPGEEVEVVRYVRYIGQNAAKYQYIYIKLTAKIKRAEITKTGIKTKIDNYWYELSGEATDGWDGISMNWKYPHNLSNEYEVAPMPWTNEALATFLASSGDNQVEFTNSKLCKHYVASDAQYRKFFFAPINVTITDGCLASHMAGYPKTWYITAKSGKADEKWNAFVCHYDICSLEDKADITCTDGIIAHDNKKADSGEKHDTWDADNMSWYRPTYKGESCNLHADKTYTTHKFAVKDTTFTTTAGDQVTELISDNAKNSEIMKKCAIDYYDGCFENTILYATSDLSAEKYTPIAQIDPATGEISLIRQDKTQDFGDFTETQYVPESVLDHIINAVGYADDQHSNISKEARTWVGVVTNNGCGIAQNLFEDFGTKNRNFSIFQTSWQRPINLVTTDPEPIEDAKNNGEVIYLYPHFAFYDWRGPNEGSMELTGKWLWGYYNIHKITWNVDPDKVLTDMHCNERAAANKWVTLGSVSKKVHLRAISSYNILTGDVVEAPTNPYWETPVFNLTKYAQAYQSASLIAYLHSNMQKFGMIFYENNGENVNTFSIKVPVTVYYEWGHFDTYLTITINSTKGNQDGL